MCDGITFKRTMLDTSCGKMALRFCHHSGLNLKLQKPFINSVSAEPPAMLGAHVVGA